MLTLFLCFFSDFFGYVVNQLIKFFTFKLNTFLFEYLSYLASCVRAFFRRKQQTDSSTCYCAANHCQNDV